MCEGQNIFHWYVRHTDSVDEGMSGVVDTCLDHLIESEAARCLLVLQFHVNVVSETFCHPVVMLGQIWEAGNLAVTVKNATK